MKMGLLIFNGGIAIVDLAEEGGPDVVVDAPYEKEIRPDAYIESITWGPKRITVHTNREWVLQFKKSLVLKAFLREISAPPLEIYVRVGILPNGPYTTYYFKAPVWKGK